MRGRIVAILLAALTTLALGATPAAAAGWRITPAGLYGASGGQVSGPISCGGSTIGGLFAVSVDRLGTIDRVSYTGCGGGFALSVTVRTPWALVGAGYSAGVTTINIRNIAAHVSGPGCAFEVAGSAGALYDNATGILSVPPNRTTVVTYVSGCFGLVAPGQYVSILSSTYVVNPRQVIELT